MANPWDAGTSIYDRDGTCKGVATGSTRMCRLESCRGLRVYVKWPDGHSTMPCSDGLRAYEDGYKII
jgi:hypothetical protein